MANRIQLRRDTTSNWENIDPVLADGEPGYDIVTNEVRIGDGSTAWTGLTANTISGGGGGSSNTLVNNGYTATLGIDGNLAVPGEITISTDNTHGGAGYTGFLTLTSTQAGVTNPNKFIRSSITGNLQIVDSAYQNTIFDLNDSGDLRLGGNLLLSSGKEIKSAAGVGNVTIEANDGVSRIWTFKAIATLNLPSFGATPGSGDGAVGDICRDGDVLYFKTSTGWKTVGLTP